VTLAVAFFGEETFMMELPKRHATSQGLRAAGSHSWQWLLQKLASSCLGLPMVQ
jgi:hypothetical protein